MAMDAMDVLSDEDLDADEVNIAHVKKLSKKRSAPSLVNQVNSDEVLQSLKRP